jgi:hypothetical protein
MFGELNPLAREVFVPFFTVLVPSICWVSKKCYGFSKPAPARAITRCKENIHCHADLPPTSTDVFETSGVRRSRCDSHHKKGFCPDARGVPIDAIGKTRSVLTIMDGKNRVCGCALCIACALADAKCGRPGHGAQIRLRLTDELYLPLMLRQRS